LIFGVIAVSTSAIFIKLSTAPSAVIAFYRLFIAAALMSPFIHLKGRSGFGLLRGRTLLYTCLAGGCLALHFLLWFESLQYTSVASSVFFVTLSPLFSYLGGYFFYGETLSWRQISDGSTAIIGGLIIGYGDLQLSGIALRGDLLAVSGAAAAAGYWLIGQNVRKELPAFAYTYILYTASAAVLLIYALGTRSPLFSFSKMDGLIFLLLALIPTLLGHSLFNWLLRWASATSISTSILAESVIASVLAYLIFGEKISICQWVGGALIVAGIYRFIHKEWRK